MSSCGYVAMSADGYFKELIKVYVALPCCRNQGTWKICLQGVIANHISSLLQQQDIRVFLPKCIEKEGIMTLDTVRAVGTS